MREEFAAIMRVRASAFLFHFIPVYLAMDI